MLPMVHHPLSRGSNLSMELRVVELELPPTTYLIPETGSEFSWVRVRGWGWYEELERSENRYVLRFIEVGTCVEFEVVKVGVQD